MTTADVGIVGGGIHGVAAAFHLARRRVASILFEQGELAGGPTGRSSAVCRAYYTQPFLARVARESLEVFAHFGEHTGGREAGYHRTGGLFLHGPEDADDVRRTAAALTAIGTRTDVLDGDDLAANFPGLAHDGVEVAAFEHGAGYADPVLTTSSLAERARELGAVLRPRTPVSRLTRPARGGGVVLHLGDGTTVTVGRLLLAAGPWTGPLVAQLGIDLPLTVERHVVAVGMLAPFPPLPVVMADVPQGYYYKPEPGATFLLGPLTEEPPLASPDELEARLHDDESTDLLGRAVRRVPALADAAPRGGWASLYDVSPDWQPIIGEVAPDVFVDAGTSGHGFKLAPALGGYVADLVLGTPDPGLADLHPRRFTTGSSVRAGYGDARILG